MPTAAKLIAGIVYSVGAVFVVWLYMQSNQRIAYLINDITLLCAAVSFIVGWIVVGGRAPKMLTKPARLGLIGGISSVLWCCLALALVFIGSRLTGSTYDSTMHVFLSVPTKVLELLLELFQIQIMAAVLIGSLIAGHIVRGAAANWK